jgi:DNA invertase Pin-like site-specific DNA recombinase
MKRAKVQSKRRRAIVAVYARVAVLPQDHRHQLSDLKQWAAEQPRAVRWYKDAASAQFPQFERLMDDVRAGRIAKLCVWRLDCLGRPGCTAHDLIELVDELTACRVHFISLREGLDLKARG